MAGRVHGMDSRIFCVCDDVKTLGWEGDDQAKEMLNRAANTVKPIMAKRKWRVAHLREFYPQNAALLGLNINHGQKVNIRLRSPQNRSVFLPYESILHTLLHELCHNAIGPHNDQFYKLLDEVMKESENLISSNGFDLVSAGMKLSNDRRNPDVVDRRRVTAAAAEKRLQRKALFKSGRLGGGEDGIHLIVDPREMAFNAVYRRLHDDKWCGNSSNITETTMEENRNADGTKPHDVIVISDDDDDNVIETYPGTPETKIR